MRRCFACFALVIVLALAAPASAQFDNVGSLSFPTSGSPAAQQRFLRGVAILHSFGWKQAIAEFKLAQQAQPDFAMAYWGETLCYNHPLQNEQDPKNPRAVLARLGPTREARLAKAPTAREKGFLGAVELLWGEGEWRDRRVKYMRAMEQLHKQYPDDDEVTTFYAVSVLSAAHALDDQTFRYEMKAGALAMDVFRRNPKHPGAPHYVIHAFDDPIHAPLALTAAKAYAQIAPAVSHAVHMPTHIFIQHGMWNEVAYQNVRAFDVANDIWEPGDVPGDLSHSGDWGQYGFLQIGDYPGARRRIQVFEQMGGEVEAPACGQRAGAPEGSLHHRDRRVEGAARRRQRVKRNGVCQRCQRRENRRHGRGREDGGEASGESGEWFGNGRGGRARRPRCCGGTRPGGRRLSQRRSGDAPGVGWSHRAGTGTEGSRRRPARRGCPDRREDAPAEWRGTDPIKPAHEALGEALLALGRPAEAAAAFEACLLRMPNRARSLMGAATAHAAAGHTDLAAERTATLNSFWKGQPFSRQNAARPR